MCSSLVKIELTDHAVAVTYLWSCALNAGCGCGWQCLPDFLFTCTALQLSYVCKCLQGRVLCSMASRDAPNASQSASGGWVLHLFTGSLALSRRHPHSGLASATATTASTTWFLVCACPPVPAQAPPAFLWQCWSRGWAPISWPCWTGSCARWETAGRMSRTTACRTTCRPTCRCCVAWAPTATAGCRKASPQRRCGAATSFSLWWGCKGLGWAAQAMHLSVPCGAWIRHTSQ
jgi:hypothetical protein